MALSTRRRLLPGGELTIRLAHGGYELLSIRHTDEKLQGLIQSWFGRSCQVEFTGRLTVKAGEGVLVEKAKDEQIRRSGRPSFRRWRNMRRP